MSNSPSGAEPWRAKLLVAVVLISLTAGIIAPCLWPQQPPAIGAGSYSQLIKSYVKTQSMTLAFSSNEVQPGEEFYFTCEIELSILKDISIPLALNGRYQVVALGPDGEEVVLGEGEESYGPAELKAGEAFLWEKHILLVFPDTATPGTYQTYIRAVEVSPPELWLAWQFMAPVTAFLGTVELRPGPEGKPSPIALWETPDENPTQAGTQVNPPCGFAGSKEIKYWAVVSKQEGGSAGQVKASVSWSPGPATDREFSYEVPMQRVEAAGAGISEFQAASEAGLVTLAGGLSLEGVLAELEGQAAEVWMGSAAIDRYQPAGQYIVDCLASGQDGAISGSLENSFEYVPVCCIELDFGSMSYAEVNVGEEKWVAGDREFGGPALSVRNAGNTEVFIIIRQTDMGFGDDGGGRPNVTFGAKLGSDPANAVYYLPGEDAVLPNKLVLGQTEEISFSIQVRRGYPGRVYSGEMTIGGQIAPF